jgi:hypothetical protein
MRRLFVIALLLAAAAAGKATPDLDEAGCVALAERMDAKLAAKQQPSAQEQQSFAECIGEFIAKSCRRRRT